MVFRKYTAELKFKAVLAANKGMTLGEINTQLASSISADSLTRWIKLYERTRAVVCNPSTYRTRGRPLDLDDEDLSFIKEMVIDKPTVYLDEIQKALTNQLGVTVSLATIHGTLHNRLSISKKTIRTVHPRQDELARASYISLIANIPSTCIVFTGKQLAFSFQAEL
jgi:transposase